MAKELPYFKFEPAEYLTGSIQFCSLAAQGLFINIQSIYWQRDRDLTEDQVKKRFNEPVLLSELINEKVIKVVNGKISIKYLDNQIDTVIQTSKKRSESGRKGMYKRWHEDNKAITSVTSLLYQTDNKPITIREDKIREDKIILNKGVNKFTPPTHSDIVSFIPDIATKTSQQFIDYYTSNGWKVGRNQMKDWKAALRNWIRNEANFQKQPDAKERRFVS